MTTVEFLSSLRNLGVSITVVDGRLRLRAPPGTMDERLKQELSRRKEEILRLLGAADAAPRDTAIPQAPDYPARLTAGQERLWSVALRNPDSSRYNLALAFGIRGLLDRDALRQSIASLVERHEILQCAIESREDGPVMVPRHRTVSLGITEIARNRRAQALEDAVEQEVHRPFVVSEEPLVRVHLFALNDDEHVLTIVMHHAISDGWSFDVFLREMAQFYAAHHGGDATRLDPLPIQFKDFAHWERSRLEGNVLNDLRDRWAEHLKGPIEALDFARPQRSLARQVEGRTCRTGMIEPSLRTQLESVGAGESATLFMVLLAAFQCALAIETGRTDFVVCSPAARRAQPEVAALIGYVNNVLPLRARVAGSPRFRDVLERVRAVTLAAHRDQDLPFQEVATLPDLRRVPLTRAMFALQSEKPFDLELAGVTVETFPIQSTGADFDVALTADSTGEGVSLTLELNPATVEDAVGDRVLASLQQLLRQVVDNPETPVFEPFDSVSMGASKASTAYVEPSDDLELELVRIWERVLDHKPIGVRDDFFSLGGHSLLAAQLFGKIEADLGHALSLSTLFERSTIEALASALREEGWAPSDRLVVPIRDQGAGTPFFFPHSYEGHVLFANAVGRALAPGHPSYGIQAVGLNGRERPLDRVDLMADRHVQEILKVQPAGPWIVVGMCFGVPVGFEVARRLNQLDKGTVEFVVLDGGFDVFEPSRGWAPAPTLLGEARRRIPAHARGLVERVQYRVQLLRSTSHERRALEIHAGATRAVRRYMPDPASFHITLIRTAEKAHDPSFDWHVESWRELARGGLRILEVPGTHLMLMTEDSAEPLADRLKACADELA